MSSREVWHSQRDGRMIWFREDDRFGCMIGLGDSDTRGEGMSEWIDAADARDLVGFLVDRFGPGVLPPGVEPGPSQV